MNHHYNDILSRISQPPLWWDEYAVPRYCTFEPKQTANIYAKAAALVEIACQSCGERFNVAFSWSSLDIKDAPKTPDEIASLHYGDPPNNGCCPSGPTMNCDDLRVIEFWRQGGEEFTEPDPNHPDSRICKPGYFDWRRVSELEVLLADAPLTTTRQD